MNREELKHKLYNEFVEQLSAEIEDIRQAHRNAIEQVIDTTYDDALLSALRQLMIVAESDR